MIKVPSRRTGAYLRFVPERTDNGCRGDCSTVDGVLGSSGCPGGVWGLMAQLGLVHEGCEEPGSGERIVCGRGGGEAGDVDGRA